MRINRKDEGIAEGDLTPMIDMTFQLIAFFMVLVNFSDAEQDKQIKLPSSELAKPPDKPFKTQRTLQLTKDGRVLFSGDIVPVAGIKPLLDRERLMLSALNTAAADVTIIIRADGNAETGKVQDLIQACQDAKFTTFALRAQQEKAGDGL